MLQDGVLWLVVADGRRARILVEPRRGALLQDPPELRMEIDAADLIEPQDRAPRAFDSMGASRHAMDGRRTPHEEEERRFLKRVADRISAAERESAFSHLVIAATPRALGLLREMLSQSATARLRGELAKDLLQEEPPRLRERLQDILRA